jgi:hypothetical protein
VRLGLEQGRFWCGDQGRSNPDTGRTRTCNQIVMSGRLSISFVDFAAGLFDFVRVRCVSLASFLARNRSGGEYRKCYRKIGQDCPVEMSGGGRGSSSTRPVLIA